MCIYMCIYVCVCVCVCVCMYIYIYIHIGALAALARARQLGDEVRIHRVNPIPQLMRNISMIQGMSNMSLSVVR